MALTQTEILQKLLAAGIPHDVIAHEAVMTAEAQVAALGPTSGIVIKNLFLKDKKSRFFIISALATTKVDLKVLAARLGLGKGGIRLADPECVEEVLQVPLGSVTPLAVANPSAKDVTLLLDHKIQGADKVLVHPLINTASVSLTPDALKAALGLFGREATFVDLEADPKIDRENPPDLAKYVPDAPVPAPAAAAGATPASSSSTTSIAAVASTPQPAAAASAKAAASGKAAGKQAKAGAGSGAVDSAAAAAAVNTQHRALSDVAQRADDVLHQVAQALLGCKLEEVKSDPVAVARLRADVEMQLTAFKNAAYTLGYLAGKGEVVGFAQKLYS